MKKIFNYILAVTALLAFAPIAKAQDDYTIKNGIGVRKTISAPNLRGRPGAGRILFDDQREYGRRR